MPTIYVQVPVEVPAGTDPAYVASRISEALDAPPCDWYDWRVGGVRPALFTRPPDETSLPGPEIVTHVSDRDGAMVVEIGTAEEGRRLRVLVNEGVIFDADPETWSPAVPDATTSRLRAAAAAILAEGLRLERRDELEAALASFDQHHPRRR